MFYTSPLNSWPEIKEKVSNSLIITGVQKRVYFGQHEQLSPSWLNWVRQLQLSTVLVWVLWARAPRLTIRLSLLMGHYWIFRLLYLRQRQWYHHKHEEQPHRRMLVFHCFEDCGSENSAMFCETGSSRDFPIPFGDFSGGLKFKFF
jgi:hypothetical protein